MEWILIIVVFICLTSLLLQIQATQKDHAATRKVLAELIAVLRKKKLIDDDD